MRDRLARPRARVVRGRPGRGIPGRCELSNPGRCGKGERASAGRSGPCRLDVRRGSAALLRDDVLAGQPLARRQTHRAAS